MPGQHLLGNGCQNTGDQAILEESGRYREIMRLRGYQAVKEKMKKYQSVIGGIRRLYWTDFEKRPVGQPLLGPENMNHILRAQQI